MTSPDVDPDDTLVRRRLCAAVAAIASAVDPIGWRVRNPPIQRDHARRTWRATFRRLSEDASVDALAIHIPDLFVLAREDLEQWVAASIAMLQQRPRNTVGPMPPSGTADGELLVTFDPDLRADTALEFELRRAYDDGVATGRAVRVKHPHEPPVCPACRWSNTGLLNYGSPEFGSLWLCHGCAARALQNNIYLLSAAYDAGAYDAGAAAARKSIEQRAVAAVAARDEGLRALPRKDGA